MDCVTLSCYTIELYILSLVIYNVDSELIQIGVYLVNCRPEMKEE